MPRTFDKTLTERPSNYNLFIKNFSFLLAKDPRFY